MPSTRLLSTSNTAHALLVLALSTIGVQAQSSSIDDMTYAGCFSSSQPLSDQGSYTYQTSGYCRPLCEDQNAAVLGLSDGSNCWCGNQLPAASSKVSDSNCNVGCNGYDKENCGGDGYWSVYTVQDNANVPNYSGGSGSSNSGGSDSSDSSSSDSSPSPSSAASPSPSPTTNNGGNNNNNQQTTAKPSVITSIAPGQTIVKTVPAAEASAPASGGPNPQETSGDNGGTNVAPIAAGVVVGVVAIAAIAGGLFWFIRKKKRQAAEDEYNRNHQVSDFMRGASERKPPTTGYSQMSDSRLDPEAGQRRDSQGSIADNQDYSRRILRVANPDGN